MRQIWKIMDTILKIMNRKEVAKYDRTNGFLYSGCFWSSWGSLGSSMASKIERR